MNGEYIQSAPNRTRARRRVLGLLDTARREARTTMKRLITSLILACLIGLPPGSLRSVSAQQATNGGGVQSAVLAGDRGWPRGYKTAGGAQIVLYQPQVASWENQRHMVAYTAASYLPAGAKKPELGTLKVE